MRLQLHSLTKSSYVEIHAESTDGRARNVETAVFREAIGNHLSPDNGWCLRGAALSLSSPGARSVKPRDYFHLRGEKKKSNSG